jgi:hypothetical protein
MRRDVEKMVADLNKRIPAHCTASHAPCYGGYRLETENGSTGFAYWSGTEARMSHKEFLLYLRGLHDMLDWFELSHTHRIVESDV